MPEFSAVYNLLWKDEDIFQKSYEKSAHALLAIEKCLTTQHLPKAQQQTFLVQYQFLADADPSHFFQVWSSPFAQQWVKLAYRLCQACFADIPLDSSIQKKYNLQPVPALCQHLGEFRHLVLAIAFLEKKSCHFNEPLRVKTPFIIPATDFYFSADGEIDIIGLSPQGLVIEQSGGQKKHVLAFKHASPCPCVETDTYRLIMQAGTFNNFPALDFAEPVVNNAIDYNADCLALVEQTLRNIQQYSPVIFQQFKQVIRFIGLKSQNDSYYSNISYSELPGCFVASMVWNPYVLADIFIHEFSHNRLFFIEVARGHVFNSQSDSKSECSFYSPWREDLRPLYGVFHAVYVYIPVYHYWRAVYQDGRIDGKLKQYTKNEIVKIVMQLKIGIYQLAKHAQFTEFGVSLFEQLQLEADSIFQSLPAELCLDIPAFSHTEKGGYIEIKDKETARPLSARAVISKHIRLYAPATQAEELNRHMKFV